MLTQTAPDRWLGSRGHVGHLELHHLAQTHFHEATKLGDRGGGGGGGAQRGRAGFCAHAGFPLLRFRALLLLHDTRLLALALLRELDSAGVAEPSFK